MFVGVIVAFMTDGSMELASFVLGGSLLATLALGKMQRLSSFVWGGVYVILANLAVLATLTRYQGLMLAPLAILAVWAFPGGKRARGETGKGATWVVFAVQLAWLAVPAWLLFQRFGHFQQVADRASRFGLGRTLLNYWNVCEMFLYITTYVLTLPVFVFFMAGLIGGPFHARGGRKEDHGIRDRKVLTREQTRCALSSPHFPLLSGSRQ